MSVVVQCFHCNALLELDEGFRGGVCRCSACGSLLQVPRGDTPPPTRLKRPAAPAPAAPPASGAARPAATDPGLSSGRLNPLADRPPARTLDPSEVGISSGLGQIHKTSPIADIPRKKKPSSVAAAPAAPARSPATPVATAPPRGEQPPAPTPRRNALPIINFLLILLIAGVIAALVYQFLRLSGGAGR